jgi:hypothetical protein
VSRDGRSPTEIALEVLSVRIGSIAEEVADLAAGPPTPPATYVSLAETFQRAGADIAALAGAMAILGGDFRLRVGDYAKRRVTITQAEAGQLAVL